MKAFDLLTGAAIAALLLAPLPVFAADAAGEIVTAQTHAGLASTAADLAGTQMHLHHALNCLVGAGGDGFDPKNINPCANAGAGAIPDTADAAKKAALQSAAATVRSGLAATDKAMAQKDAAEAATALKAIK
ncbi:MAG TPA: hypothetical protein VHZ78_01415 [Rhizomicrobium sp.]|jgi:hypothetical protein|nr:hypothetical protein [Rhizomicrobium sp.]